MAFDIAAAMAVGKTVVKAGEEGMKTAMGIMKFADEIATRVQKVTISVENRFDHEIKAKLSRCKEKEWVEIKSKNRHEFKFWTKPIATTTCWCTIQYKDMSKLFTVYGDGAPRQKLNIYEVHFTHVMENYVEKMKWDGWPSDSAISTVQVPATYIFSLEIENVDEDYINADGETLLHFYAASGNVGGIKRLISKNPALINVLDNFYQQPIHLAAENDQYEVLNYLIENGADVKSLANYENDEKDDVPSVSPLHYAACNGHVDCAKLLLEHGAETNQQDKNGWTPLHQAIEQNQLKTVECLLEENAEANVKTKNGWIPLHFACKSGNLEIVKLLLQKTGNVNDTTEKGWAPLHVACQNGHLKIVEFLLKNGAKIDLMTKTDWTSLHISCYNGHYEIAKLLLENGAEVNLMDYDVWTPLHFACSAGHLNIVELLLQNGAKIDMENEDGWTPFHYACKNEHFELAEFLLKSGANIDEVNEEGWTSLQFACFSGHFNVAKFLIENDANVNVVNELTGWTSLQCACFDGNFEIVKLLLEKGAKIDTKDIDDWTPLHFACSGGNLNVVILLLEKGANVNAATKENQKPIDVAYKNGHSKIVELLQENGDVEIVELLLRNGAKINAVNKDGKTPWDNALESGSATKFSKLDDINYNEIVFPDPEKELGVGGFGRVLQGLYKNKKVAVRLLNVKHEKETIKQESEMLIKCRHKNIVEYFGVFYGIKNGIVLELMEGGSLNDILHEFTHIKYSYCHVSVWSQQILDALEYLHLNSIIHRNLKPVNILMANDFLNLKLSDFGTVREIDTSMGSFIGTMAYMAPKAITHKYDYTCDIYSFGVILWELLARELPGFNKNALYNKIASHMGELQTLIKSCWKDDSNERPTINDIKNIIKTICCAHCQNSCVPLIDNLTGQMILANQLTERADGTVYFFPPTKIDHSSIQNEKYAGVFKF